MSNKTPFIFEVDTIQRVLIGNFKAMQGTCKSGECKVLNNYTVTVNGLDIPCTIIGVSDMNRKQANTMKKGEQYVIAVKALNKKKNPLPKTKDPADIVTIHD